MQVHDEMMESRRGRGSSRYYHINVRPRIVGWVGICVFLVLTALFGYFFLRPFLQVRAAVQRWWKRSPTAVEIERLGGTKSASWKVALYVKCPSLIAPREDRLFALLLLKYCNQDGIPALVSLLNSADPEIRQEAAVVLGQVGGPSVVPVLVGMLGDEDAGVRGVTVLVLGDLRAQEAIEPLEEMVTGDDSQVVRDHARQALEKIRGWR